MGGYCLSSKSGKIAFGRDIPLNQFIIHGIQKIDPHNSMAETKNRFLGLLLAWLLTLPWRTVNDTRVAARGIWTCRRNSHSSWNSSSRPRAVSLALRPKPSVSTSSTSRPRNNSGRRLGSGTRSRRCRSLGNGLGTARSSNLSWFALHRSPRCPRSTGLPLFAWVALGRVLRSACCSWTLLWGCRPHKTCFEIRS